MTADLSLRRAIAAELLGCEPDPDGYAECPGAALHTSRTGRRDFRVALEGPPTGFCFHSSCAAKVDAFNFELRRRIGQAERSGHGRRQSSPLGPAMPAAPAGPPQPKRPAFDLARLQAFAKRVPQTVTPEWLAERSPLPVPPPQQQGPTTAALFLGAVYQPVERVLIFNRQWSQGDWLWTEGKAYRLAERPGVRAVRSPLPEGGPEGVWFLTNPVCGQWLPNHGIARATGTVKLGRRHGDCITAWRFLLLESDSAPEDLWLRALVQMPLPVVALYSSGGRSIHALVRVEARSKLEWDALRTDLLPILAPLGADPAAMSAVRLSRLPGVRRHGTRGRDGQVVRYGSPRLQRLLWLHPGAPVAPILEVVKR